MLISSLVLSAALSAAPATESFALVVTNNRSGNSRRATLRYADDDGVAFADLFSEQFGATHTVLLTELDDETRALAPGYAQVPRPTLAELDRAVDTLAAALDRARAEGHDTELFVVLAGHGDVDDGEGYFELLDTHLTSHLLESHLITKLKVERLHLIVDACNSYFLLNPRKPGGRRWAAEAMAGSELSARYPWVGTLVSSNAEAVSYEWSELRSGIFSYEVRSGLRGAADANHDQVITYQELAAFIDRANAAIPNEQYRPRVGFTPPKGAPGAALFTVNEHAARLVELSGEGPRHVVVRNALGVRLLDAHQEAGARLALALPAGSTALGLYEQVQDGDRPRWVYREVPAGFHGSVDELPAGEPPRLPRGEAPIFDALFSQPFGPLAYAEWEGQPKPPVAPSYGVTRADVERLSQALQDFAGDASMRTWAVPWSRPSMLTWGELVEPLRLWQRLHSFDLDDDRSRALAVQVTERDFEQVARHSRTTRLVFSGLALGIGAGITGLGIYAEQSSARSTSAGGADLVLGFGIGAVLGGLIGLLIETSSEHAWNAYRKAAERAGLSVGGPVGGAATRQF